MTIEERFMSHVKVADNGCWQWDGFLYHGYGKFKIAEKLIAAHRLSYEMFVGDIPEGLVVDHNCHNKDITCTDGNLCLHRSCVNPQHLDPVTGDENKYRSPLWLGNRKLCKRGHEFDTKRRSSNGQRVCSKCIVARKLEKQNAS